MPCYLNNNPFGVNLFPKVKKNDVKDSKGEKE